MRFKFIKFTLVLGTILFSSQGFSQELVPQLFCKLQGQQKAFGKTAELECFLLQCQIRLW